MLLDVCCAGRVALFLEAQRATVRLRKCLFLGMLFLDFSFFVAGEQAKCTHHVFAHGVSIVGAVHATAAYQLIDCARETVSLTIKLHCTACT